MTPRIERHGEDRILLTGTTPTQVPTVRQIPGARFRKDQWTLPLSWASCVVARGVFGSDLAVGPELAEWSRAEHKRRIQPALAYRRGECDIDSQSQLYPFQQVGVQFLRTAGSALLADEMGTGKTLQTITTLEADELYPALIVAPNGVKRGWRKEFARWAPHRRVAVAGNGTETAKKAVDEVSNGLADVLVVHWEALRSLSRLAAYGSLRLEPCSDCNPRSKRRPDLCQRHDKALNLVAWAAVIADEAHRAKNPTADQTRALWALGDRADRRIALTGTPIANHAGDLWSVMRFVAPEEYPAKSTWVDRYALQEQNFFSGGKDIKGLRADTRPELDQYFLPRFLRRTKAEVLPDLPPKVYERRDIDLTGKQLKAYRDLYKNMVAEIAGGLIMADNALTANLRLRQLASAYGTVVHTDGPLWDDQVKLEEPSSKLDEFETVMTELGDRQVVVFAESSQLIKLAAARLDRKGISFVTYMGETSDLDRGRAIERFTDGTRQVFLATTGAGGEGLDGLQIADTCIFLQRPWSMIQNQQAEDRLHRIGQEGQSVTYIDLVTHVPGVPAEANIEWNVLTALETKRAALEDVVRDKEDE